MLCMVMSMADSPKDKRKVERLYEKYHKLMYVLAYNILKNHEDAEDAAIASWEKIIRHLDKIDEVECMETKGYLTLVVERTAVDFYRRNKKRNKRQVLLDEYQESFCFATRDNGLENIELYQTLRHIPKKYSEVLILYYVNDLAGREIAELLGIREDAVMTRLSRGRKWLRKELGGDK